MACADMKKGPADLVSEAREILSLTRRQAYAALASRITLRPLLGSTMMRPSRMILHFSYLDGRSRVRNSILLPGA